MSLAGGGRRRWPSTGSIRSLLSAFGVLGVFGVSGRRTGSALLPDGWDDGS